MMISIRYGRASRGLTAIPFTRETGRNRKRSAAAQRQRRAAEGRFLGPRGAPASRRGEET
ncbi:hypothetical protein RJJ37_31885 [Rhizobium redzepovicii]|uniref:Uncharacterized protein n=1 Tax=Rhizobium redzepovicii TaxID=2867518 RepID=A0AAW8PAU5_9HYPH|nr:MULTISPECIES: hypothetical protein [Rhizobium]MBB3646680.1 hypothetical protein [Rhizobium sp. BK619]MDR9764169.1 hypothetical protein [Rhizobium redzepovicii]MDR9781082.1 hypothetical protein [Rhizobium redzepovicii]